MMERECRGEREGRGFSAGKKRDQSEFRAKRVNNLGFALISAEGRRTTLNFGRICGIDAGINDCWR